MYALCIYLEFLDEKSTVGKRFPGNEIPVWSKFPPAPADITSKDGLEKINPSLVGILRSFRHK